MIRAKPRSERSQASLQTLDHVKVRQVPHVGVRINLSVGSQKQTACLAGVEPSQFGGGERLPKLSLARRWIEAVRGIGAGLRAAVVTSSDEARPKRQHYPARNDYLEDSRMAREMFTL